MLHRPGRRKGSQARSAEYPTASEQLKELAGAVQILILIALLLSQTCAVAAIIELIARPWGTTTEELLSAYECR